MSTLGVCRLALVLGTDMDTLIMDTDMDTHIMDMDTDTHITAGVDIILITDMAILLTDTVITIIIPTIQEDEVHHTLMAQTAVIDIHKIQPTQEVKIQIDITEVLIPLLATTTPLCQGITRKLKTPQQEPAQELAQIQIPQEPKIIIPLQELITTHQAQPITTTQDHHLEGHTAVVPMADLVVAVEDDLLAVVAEEDNYVFFFWKIKKHTQT